LGYQIKIGEKCDKHGNMIKEYNFSMEIFQTQTLMEDIKIDLSEIRYEVGGWTDMPGAMVQCWSLINTETNFGVI
jgi:hypothetical protein